MGAKIRRFHLGDILSVTTRRFVALRGMDGISELLGFMTGDSPYVHQVPRFAEECAPWILRQHPQLAAVNDVGLSPDTWTDWLGHQVRHYGEFLEIHPIPRDDHDSMDPAEELRRMMQPGGRLLPVVLVYDDRNE
ncbi:MAG: hypothetical protein HYY93_10560 [Planctomycetes bacterium]|nr:hypothetical protein [Planctomycetota bacterium]